MYISQFITQGQSIINGILLLAIIVWLPGGLVDPVRWRRLRARRRGRKAVDAPSTEPGPVVASLDDAGVVR